MLKQIRNTLNAAAQKMKTSILKLALFSFWKTQKSYNPQLATIRSCPNRTNERNRQNGCVTELCKQTKSWWHWRGLEVPKEPPTNVGSAKGTYNNWGICWRSQRHLQLLKQGRGCWRCLGHLQTLLETPKRPPITLVELPKATPTIVACAKGTSRGRAIQRTEGGVERNEEREKDRECQGRGG